MMVFNIQIKYILIKRKKSNGAVSFSRIGNSLDNCEIEYWFGIIKTELLNDLDYSEITFDELNLKIKEYVDLYNKERIQSNLEWKHHSKQLWC
ncbi:IS3 family transposase [Mycoplasmopsis felis]|nr:IS3 family transposase [Mycoplasmopsis felis]WAM00694.1 IS3 family transposase [Mycoplasmopsis felis]